MSTLKTNAAQIGQSVTPAQNFTLYTPATPDGTVRLGLGNAGSTTADILNINGSGVVAFNRIGSDGQVLQFNRQSVLVGNVSVTSSGTTYATSSDARLKTDIRPIDNSVQKLMSMNPIIHRWKSDPTIQVHGFIAQEMQLVVPEAVTGNPDEDAMMSMDYGRITPILVAALQEAHRKIESLENRLNSMEKN